VTALSTDVLVIGGGATGAGVAWDAALRGFDVVLADRGDLANEVLARKVMELAKAGERDPERLCEGVLMHFQQPPPKA